MRVSSWISCILVGYCLVFRGWDIRFLNYVQYLGVIFDGKIMRRLPTATMDDKAYRMFIRAQMVCRIWRLMADINICKYGTHYASNNLRLIPLGNCGRHHRKASFSARSTTSHTKGWSERYCTRGFQNFLKFIIYTQNYVGSKRKSSEIMRNEPFTTLDRGKPNES
jgi:hypothetical protein